MFLQLLWKFLSEISVNLWISECKILPVHWFNSSSINLTWQFTPFQLLGSSVDLKKKPRY